MSKRNALLNIWMIVLCAGSLRALPSWPTPVEEVSSTCSVNKANSASESNTEFAFSGKVRGGEVYSCEFLPGFVFALMPTSEGWKILIADSEFRAQENPGVNLGEVPKIPQQRKFIFHPDVHGSYKDSPTQAQIESIARSVRGSLDVPDFQGAGNHDQADAKGDSAAMSFDVSLRLLVVDGSPVYQVGAGVSAPRAIQTPEPKYSKEARQAKYEGDVNVLLIVDSEGIPRNIVVVKSIGKGLDENAVEAVRTWRFSPALRDSKPVPVLIQIVVNFRLN